MDREEALKRQFVREARIGMTLIGVTLAVFVLVAYYKMSGRFGNSTDMGTAAANVTASTLNPESQRTHTANATVAAIQAATRSVVDQVEPQRGDTSPTQAPPMPIPKVFNGSALPNSELPERKTAPVDDPSAQITGRNLDTNMPVGAPGELATNRRTFTPTPLIALAKSGKQDYYAALAGDASAQISVAPPSQTPEHQGHSTESNSVLNRPIPQASADSKSKDPIGELLIESKRDANGDVAPTAASELVVRVAAGDSLWGIAQKHYGDGRYFRALAAYNGLDKANSAQMIDGSQIRLPALKRLQSEFPALMANDSVPTNAGETVEKSDPAFESVYVTGADETLFGIARDQLGQASRYVEIIELNATQLPTDVTSSTKLPAGMRLVLTHK